MHTCHVTHAFFGKSEAAFGHFQLDDVRGASVHPVISINIELPVHIQNEEEMLSVLSTALALDGANYSIKLNFVLINCIYKYCTFYIKVVGCFLKLLMVLKFHIDQHEKLFAGLCFVTVSGRSSH